MCDNCGAAFRCSNWHSTSYNNWVWECSSRYRGHKCGNIHIYEEQMQTLLREVFRQALCSRGNVTEKVMQMITDLPSVSADRANAIQGAISSSQPVLFAQSDALLAVKEIRVQRDCQMKVIFIDGSEETVPVPRYSPRKGYAQ